MYIVHVYYNRDIFIIFIMYSLLCIYINYYFKLLYIVIYSSEIVFLLLLEKNINERYLKCNI